MSHPKLFRYLSLAAVAAGLMWGSAQIAGCADDPGNNVFPDGPDGSTDDGNVSTFDGTFNTGDGGQVGAIKIQPLDPVVDVSIDDGVVTAVPVTFVALGDNNTKVTASFSLDRGELGSLVPSTGVFTASGNASGTGTVTATFGTLKATTTLTVRIKMSQNGPNPNSGVPDGGAGGYAGVGGSGPGPVVSNPTKALLLGAAQKPLTPQELGFLYPYDKTVWPRGILAPLLQWQSTHAATAVRVHLEQKAFSFDGFYGGTNVVNEPIDPIAWKKALVGNTGDALHVDVYVTDGTTVWGPISEDWSVAKGSLKGTVYYNSYNSRLNSLNNTVSTGAVLAIQPGDYAPTLAVPSLKGQCHVCHEMSADGSTLFTQVSSSLVDNSIYYGPNSSYAMTNNGQLIASYTGNAPDNSLNDRKFLWSGVYPDGTMGLTNSRHAREHNGLDSALYARSNGSKIAANGLTGVTSAVTPAFSPDGRRVSFNFWEGAGGSGVTNGAGHSLAIMDFDCGAQNGSTKCASPPYTFSNLKELYRDANTWPAWPSFTPDAAGVVFHNAVTKGTCTDCEIATWFGAQSELWYTTAPKSGSPSAVRMNLMNGLDVSNASYLPTNGMHAVDAKLNYEPTVNPVASGGYYWVVFTSRRLYGNVATGDPYGNGDGTYPITKKLWVAAIDANPQPGKDPSHPAFYLPGQEINAGNMRAFWVTDPCQPNGDTCETGDECCNGFCRVVGDGGGLVCTDKPGGCAQEFEKCSSDGDCCGVNAGYKCLGGHCGLGSPN
ncbi:hypothetical protein BH09MYX1_BH09MYX1_38720 [soil metagenome]